MRTSRSQLGLSSFLACCLLAAFATLGGCGDGGDGSNKQRTGECKEHSADEATCGTCVCVECEDNVCVSRYCNTSCVETGNGPEDAGADTAPPPSDASVDTGDGGATPADAADTTEDAAVDTSADAAPDTETPQPDVAPDVQPDTSPADTAVDTSGDTAGGASDVASETGN